jgi:sugar phosphate isomerase/epimerase
MVRIAYNANGLRNLSLAAAIRAVAQAGYEGIELSLHPSHIDPFSFTPAQAAETRRVLADAGVAACCLATGADTLLGPERFEPSLIHPDAAERGRRVDMIRRGIDLAEELGVPVVNFASGIRRDGRAADEVWERLEEGVRICLEHARDAVVLAIEPEPGFLVETNAQAARLVRRLGSAGLCINQDVGHANVVEDDYLDSIRRALPLTGHMHIEDIKGRHHHHEIPGDGDIDFRAVFDILHDGGYDGFVSVELYNHADVYPTALRRSLVHLSALAA